MKSVPVKYINTQIGTPFYTPLDYRNLGKLLQRVCLNYDFTQSQQLNVKVLKFLQNNMQ